LPAVTDDVKIQRSLFICFVPRAGSLYLAGLVASTGVAGRPTEAFHSPLEQQNRERHGIESDEAYFDWVRSTSVTPNGSFGCKLTYHALQDVLGRLRRTYGNELADIPLLAQGFPNPVFVWLRRRDTVAQAVSWARALQTDQWVSPAEAKREPVYDFELIDRQVATIRGEENAWANWFAKNGVDPPEIYYEDVLTDPRPQVERVLDTLAVTLPPDVELRPYQWAERQGDGVNEQWIERYRSRAFAKRWFPGARLLT
jgi:LPS sulfotransferase NodH